MSDLQRFRPLIRIQTFIEMRKKQKGYLAPEIENKRRAVIRDWFWLVIWFIRLRKSAQGTTPEKLIQVEERIQRNKFFNGVTRVKQSKLADYIPNKGSDGETSSEVEEMKDDDHSGSVS